MEEKSLSISSILSLSKIPDPPTLMGPERYQYASLKPFIETNCPNGGIIFDIGCGSGRLGAKIAFDKDSYLIQADLFDDRDALLKDTKVTFLQLEKTQPPQFDSQYHKTADAVLLVNVLQNIIYPENTPLKSKIQFLRSLIPLLKPGGKILIDISHPSGDYLRNNYSFRELVNTDEELKNRLVFSQ